MKPFCFQQFQVQQNQEVFRVGTDAVLLGVLSEISFAKTILEVGTGTGIVSLMLAQRHKYALIKALDINEKAYELARSNFEDSPFSERLHVFYCDFKLYQSDEKFDLIISNPPYFDVNDSEKDVLARQKVELGFVDLVVNAARLLALDGCFTVIIPSLDSELFESICKSEGLYLKRKVQIKGIKDGVVRRVVLEFSFSKSLTVLETFVIEKSPRQYSEEYLTLTKDFHIFKNKRL